jgi:hypothetical protein
MQIDPSAVELIFLVRAWKAAFAKAQSLGWLNVPSLALALARRAPYGSKNQSRVLLLRMCLPGYSLETTLVLPHSGGVAA